MNFITDLNLNQLPEDIKQIADSSYELLKNNPNHPSLHFKKVNKY